MIKKFKVQFIPSNQLSNCNLQIHPYAFSKEKCLQIGQILEVSKIQASNANLSSSFSAQNSIQNEFDDTNVSPILLQITQHSLVENIPLDTIRIDPAAASDPFHIKSFYNVNVTQIDDVKQVTLDLVELTFREQYLNGSDMWRIKKHVENTCVFFKKNVEFCGMRVSVREMWNRGETVSCGYISENTRLVFRSLSAMCTIYIQMSREMWEFDVNGEMYNEKAVNFLSELFTNWKKEQCQHDVTIALFSRVFYEAKSIEEFPQQVTACIKQDYKGRFFEDFYRVIYQNERYDDWMFSLVKLKHLIKDYRDYIQHYHENTIGQPVAKCHLSSAVEGNILETFNLSSSVFERQFIDRPFDRTGMMSVVITGGCGLFEVNRELSRITKERVIDNGIGSDLVCLGEQPFHKVPLFKFANTDTFSVPAWINLSFYKSSEHIRYCNSVFKPCIKLKFKEIIDTNLDPDSILPGYDPYKGFDDDELDYNSPPQTLSKKQTESALDIIGKAKGLSKHVELDNNIDDDSSFEFDSDPETTISNSVTSSSSTTNLKDTPQSKKQHIQINPFSPSTIKEKPSFDRRRWTHAFPLRADGSPIYDHHHWHFNEEHILKSSCVTSTISDDQNTQPIMTTGVAWKSLTMPACLPLTTDFYPSDRFWYEKFQQQANYTLILNDIRDQYEYLNYDRNHAKTQSVKEVFIELVGHRLAMGFQMVTIPKFTNSKNFYKLSLGRSYHEIYFDEQSESIVVKIHIPLKKLSTHIIKYSYRFQIPDSITYDVSHHNLCVKSIENINWNKIDVYICIQGNGSLSPLMIEKCWRQRLYLLPIFHLRHSLSTSATLQLSQALQAKQPCRFDVYKCKSIDELKLYRENYFLRFMEYLNKVQRTDERRIMLETACLIKSQSGLKLTSPKEKLEHMLNEYKTRGGGDATLRKQISIYLEEEYKVHMLDSKNGIPFLKEKIDIPNCCFISAEATWWCIQNVNDIDTESHAINFMQTMIDFDHIKHISKQEAIYIHGFYLFYIFTNETKSHYLFTKDYCEVGLCELEQGLVSDHVSPPFDNKLPLQSKLLPVLLSDCLTHTNKQNPLANTDTVMKMVNVDVDPNGKSNRIEWASALYRPYHHPLCAFELEIYWKMATGQLLSELINNWSKLAIKYNFHLVPSTIDPFVLPIDSSAICDPLRGPIHVQLNLNCLLQNEKFLFENYIEKKYNQKKSNFHEIEEFCSFLLSKFPNTDPLQELHNELIEQEYQEFLERERMIRLQYLQEAILERFGFIRNASIVKQLNSDEDPTFFIHCSGAMFALIPNYYGNYTARSRHASSANNSSSSNSQQSASLMKKDSFGKSKPQQQQRPTALTRDIKEAQSRERSQTKSQQLYYQANKGNINSNNDIKTNGDLLLDNLNEDNKMDELLLLKQRQPFYEDNDLFIGFLWSWNSMLGKRFKNQYTGEEYFHDACFADFKLFCTNKDGRLVEFYNKLKS